MESNNWSSHYWFTLHTIALNYPITPNKVTKKKYYDLVMNIPLFIPNAKDGNKFSELLDKYPVTPYLDSRDAFIKWTHFIHNRVNKLLNKPLMSYEDFIEKYTYLPKKNDKNSSSRLNYDYKAFIILLLVFIIIVIYNR
jgi:hypothetical protein